MRQAMYTQRPGERFRKRARILTWELRHRMTRVMWNPRQDKGRAECKDCGASYEIDATEPVGQELVGDALKVFCPTKRRPDL